MRRFPPFAAAWGTCCGAALGALKTRDAALHLLAKNRALETLGVASLPGPFHWNDLAGLRAPWAGALFFGLSLGLGGGCLAGFWVSLFPAAERGAGKWLPWAALTAALPPLAGGDPALAAALLALTTGACLARRGAPRGVRGVTLGCALVLAVGLFPWAAAPEGPFTRLRDRVLLSNPAGLAVNDFYYRWTLYPAEALKPLGALSQPTVAPRGPGSETGGQPFCGQARALRVFCVAAPEAGDAALEATPTGLVLSLRGTRTPWPSAADAQRSAWKRFGEQADRTGPLRRATALALFAGCPLGLLAAASWLCARVGARLCPGSPRAAALFLASCVAAPVALGGSGVPESERLRAAVASSPVGPREALQRFARSPRPVERLYGARAAADLGADGRALLAAALEDPVVNVRYTAAEALGRVGGPGVEPRLAALVRGTDEWYVKERAYAALWRLGWKPL